MKSEIVRPELEEIDEARRVPNGWVYRIAGVFGDHEHIPAEAIVGFWKVNERGEIVGPFKRNDNYDPKKWPPR